VLPFAPDSSALLVEVEVYARGCSRQILPRCQMNLVVLVSVRIALGRRLLHFEAWAELARHQIVVGRLVAEDIP